MRSRFSSAPSCRRACSPRGTAARSRPRPPPDRARSSYSASPSEPPSGHQTQCVVGVEVVVLQLVEDLELGALRKVVGGAGVERADVLALVELEENVFVQRVVRADRGLPAVLGIVGEIRA